MTWRHRFTVALSLCVLGLPAVPTAAAQSAAPPKRLLHEELKGFPDQETIVEVLELAPGGVIPWHRHPDGHEIAYLLDGEAILEIEGRGARTVKAGEAWHIQPGVVHGGRNHGSALVKVLIVRINTKGKPLAAPAQR